MEIFTILFYTGILGIVASLFLGFARFGHHRGGGSTHRAGPLQPGVGHHALGPGHSSSGHQAGMKGTPSHGASPAQANSSATPAGGHGHASTSGTPAPTLAPRMTFQTFFMVGFGIISPLNIFAFCLAFGATGLLLSHFIAARWLTTLAILAGLIFTFGVIGPMMSLLMKFESTPSSGLQGLVSAPVSAISAFDDSGRGLVLVELDGQLRQVLAKLDPHEISNGIKVHKGDQLYVMEVDSQSNQILVSKELS